MFLKITKLKKILFDNGPYLNKKIAKKIFQNNLKKILLQSKPFVHQNSCHFLGS